MAKPMREMIEEANEDAVVAARTASGTGSGGTQVPNGPETEAPASDAPVVSETYVVTPIDPMTTGMASLADAEPLRLWKTKAPKGVGGEIMAVLLQSSNDIVMIHQRPSGKFVVFRKAQ